MLAIRSKEKLWAWLRDKGPSLIAAKDLAEALPVDAWRRLRGWSAIKLG